MAYARSLLAGADEARLTVQAGREPPARDDVMIFLPRFGTGGVERVACLLANGFAAEGLAVGLACIDRTGPVRPLVEPRVDVTPLPIPACFGRAGRAVKQFAALPALAAQIRRRRPKVLLSPGNHAHLAAAAALALAGARETRLVLKMTNPVVRAGRGRLEAAVLRSLYRRLFARADRVLTLSAAGAERLRAEAPEVDRAKFVFVHNPYVAEGTGASSPPAPGEPPLILAVGRLSRQKNFGLLLDAAARLKDRPWRLAILGCGPAEAGLKARAERLGVANRTVFPGFVDDPGPYYRAAHLLALSSLWEDLPAVAVEALACGCPVLATDCSPALSELVAGSGRGWIVRGEVAAFAAVLRRALDLPPDRSAVPRAACYGVDRGVEDHLRALRPLLAGAGREGAGAEPFPRAEALPVA